MLTTVIVGGSPTGVEMAGAIAEIAHQTLSDEFQSIRTAESRIVLAEAGPTILATFPERLRNAARKSLLKLGVEVRENAPVTRVEHETVWLGAERIEAGTIIWAAGITASPLGKTLGAPTDRAGRVQVQKDLTIPGHPEVFVVGDLASLTDEDGHPYPGVAQVAMQQAQQAARNVIRAIENQPHAEFHYKNLGNMATIGRGSAVADIGPLKASGLFAWLIWVLIHIFWLIGFRNRFTVMSQWAFSYLTMQRGVRLITGGQLWPGSEKSAGKPHELTRQP